MLDVYYVDSSRIRVASQLLVVSQTTAGSLLFSAIEVARVTGTQNDDTMSPTPTTCEVVSI